MTFWRWLMWCLSWLSSDPADLATGHARAAASIAAARATMVQGAEPTPAPSKECCVECRGTGYITHGDGHRTQCPCPGDCPCKTKACPDGKCPIP